MKNKLYILIILISLSFVSLAQDEKVKESKTIEVTVEADGDKVTKKVIINGKELSPEEIKEFEASGQMKIIHLDKDRLGTHGSKMIFIKSDNDSPDTDINVEVIMDKLTDYGNGHQVWNSDDGKEIKIITKSLHYPGDNSAISLGFMTMQQADGLHVGYLLDSSDAKKVGLKPDDLIIKINGIDFTVDKDNNHENLVKLKTFKEGDMIKVEVEREGKSLQFDVQAKRQNFSFMRNPSQDFIKWLEYTEENESSINKELKVMIFTGDDKDFKLNTDDINIVFPKELGDMNVFVSDGKSTANLLGKNHELSSLSHELGKYFNTKDGVLVLHVEDTNAFALKDGDVIKSIDGEKVNSPKDVIKQLLKADSQEDIKIKIIRHKRNKTLKYNK